MSETDRAPKTTKCFRCGRTLRSAQSIARGYGRTCQAHITAAAKTSVEKPAQVAKAVEAIELGSVVPLTRRGVRVFRTVSSKGDATYLTAAHNCNCPAGLKGRACYHTLAVQLITAA